MTTSAQSSSAGVFGHLVESVSTAGRFVADMELEKKLSPLVDTSKQALQTGLRTAAHVSTQAREVVSQEKLWEEQHALVDSLVEVLSLQQALVEDLRARVAKLEAAR